ncbi:hydantoinase/oxoprolinase family protein [Alphaproteobacteria bacterium]|jgi:N-methylhydantoinase A|nr:hydantoinase/oxoprolinase family protein [Alphaproteobacteria bacterium]
MRLSVDIGGTFTDIVLENGNALLSKKMLTTTSNPEVAVIKGIEELLNENNISSSRIEIIFHGTTLATNSIIERKGAHTCFITTEGFKDVLDIGYESRFDQYDLLIEKTLSVIPRKNRFVVNERINVDGKVISQIDTDRLKLIADQIDLLNFESIAIGFLHSYVNSKHETIARDFFKKRFPNKLISISSEVCPEIREYERFSTTVINAYIKPLMSKYLQILETLLIEKGFKCPLLLMTSGGSLTNIKNACDFPVRLVESGPAGGAILAASIAEELDLNKVISFDMGGTTAKITMIEDKIPDKAREFEVDRKARFKKGSGFPLRIPVIEMVEIGAGGGSIAKINKLDQVVIGPGSAGSMPGPSCYGLGGKEATITDADLLIGKINPKYFAGGRIKLLFEESKNVISNNIGSILQIKTELAALAISEMVDETMANAARVHAVEKGHETSGRVLIGFGGAAPLHIARVAEKLKVKKIIIPTNAGVGSAVGFLKAPLGYEVVKSLRSLLKNLDFNNVNLLLNDMRLESQYIIGNKSKDISFKEERFAFMRYAGQGHEIKVSIENKLLKENDIDKIQNSFENEYKKLYGRILPNADIEILTWSLYLSLFSKNNEKSLIKNIKFKKQVQSKISTKILNIISGEYESVPVFLRNDLNVGDEIIGPSVIVEDQTTTIATDNFNTHILANGYLQMDWNKDG